MLPLADLIKLTVQGVRRHGSISEISRLIGEGGKPLSRLLIHARNNRELRRWLASRGSLIFIASFFRSGNTWTRCLLADILLQNRGVKTDTSHSDQTDKLVPDIYDDLVSRRILTSDEVLAVKTHEPFLDNLSFLEPSNPGQVRFLYLYRSPEDALVSYYHFRLLTSPVVARWSDIRSFARKEFPIWKKHVASYLEAADTGAPVFFMSYERLLAEPEFAFGSILRWIGVPHAPDQVRHAVENVKFANLRALEENKRKGPQNGEFFFRRGSSGDGAAELGSDIAAGMQEEAAALLARLDERAATSLKDLASHGGCSPARAKGVGVLPA